MSADAVRLTDGQRLAWLRLIRSENVGPVTFRELINHFGSAEEALEAIPRLSARSGRAIRIADRDEAERELEAIERSGAHLVALGEGAYPGWLRHIDSAPPLLTVAGSRDCLVRPAVALVGSRNASVAGRRYAMELAAGLGRADYAVASGLARGIDAAAHEASLARGTIAVLAGGLDRIYPPEHEGLAARIIENGGALVSEMPMGWEPRARDFPRRNRIVSGVAIAVIVIEAASRSGSLITARLAAEQGRLVFAVPGSPLDPRAAGTNRLIRDGAQIVTELDDILTNLRPLLDRPPEPPQAAEPRGEGPSGDDAADDERSQVISALGPTPVAVDEVIRFTGLRPAVVHLVLIELDLAGRLERHAGQRVSLLP